jgi:hypothetical protein
MAEEQHTLIQNLEHQLQMVKPPQRVVPLMYAAVTTSNKPELQAAISRTFSSTFDALLPLLSSVTLSLFYTVKIEAIEEGRKILSVLVKKNIENTI